MTVSLFKKLSKAIAFMLFITTTSVYAAPPTFTTNPSINDLVARIQGPGITITNPQITRSNGNQLTLFSDGTQAGLAIDTGITMATMQPANIYSTNGSRQTSDTMGGTGNGTDPDLLAIDGNARFDTVVFEFDVTMGDNTKLLLVNYQFASEEYNEYVGSRFNDAFGFFVSGGDLNGTTYNIARVVNPNIFTTPANLTNFPPVTVNNVNNGTLGRFDDATPQDLTNSQYFIDNNGDYDNPGPGPIDVEFDGITVGLNGTLDNLTPGVTYHFKMALADVGDAAWDTGVFINSINGIRAPEVCYEYGYQQNGRFFTEVYDPTSGPNLVGDVVLNDPVTVNISVQNREQSEIIASNVRISVDDINATQAPYTPESVYVTNTDTLLTVHVPDNTQGMTNTSTYIHNIPALDFGSLDFFYVEYDVTPLVNTLDMPLNFRLDYTLTVQLSPTQSVDFNVSANLDEDIPNCTGGGYSYDPTWDIFNVEDHAIANTGKYNLYTQVAGRPFTFDLVSYDSTVPTTSVPTTAFVAIEMIDSKGFQTVGAACRKPSSAFSPRIWTYLDNATQGVIDVQQAVDDLLIGDVSEFFPAARERAAFRISYLLDENGTSPITYTKVGPDQFQVTGFPDLQGRECSIDPRTGDPKLVKKPNNNQFTDQANVACGNAGTGGVSSQTLRNCLECLYDANVAYICSRDAFAIRPEAFNVQIYDNDEIEADIGLNQVGEFLPKTGNIAAGYNYRYDVNATLHNNDVAPAAGYTRSYPSVSIPNSSFTYYWRPDATRVISGCNDMNDKNPKINLINGATVKRDSVGNLIHSLNRARNVGQYELELVDNNWTSFDQNPIHHSDPAKAVYYDQTPDCALNQSFTPNTATVLDNTNVGCMTSSSHLNPTTNYLYTDYNITVVPYFFDISQIQFEKGTMAINTDYNASEALDINATTGELISILARSVDGNLSQGADLNLSNAFVYQNNLRDATDDLNMSVRYTGHISARGADDNLTTNFVANCFAQNINLDAHTSNINQAGFPAYSYRLREWDNNGTLLRDDINGSYDSIIDVANNNNLVSAITLPAGRFEPSGMGAVNIELNLNFDRQVNTAINPITVTYNDFNVTCTNLIGCQSRSNTEIAHDANGSYTIENPTYTPLSVTHLYGRAHTPRQRSGNVNVTVPIAYEFYCDSTAAALPAPCTIGAFDTLPNPLDTNNSISPNALASVDAVRWYVQNLHNVSQDGNATVTQTRLGTKDPAFGNMQVDLNATSASYIYTGGTFPYKATMQVNTPDWLIYNRFDGSATVNQLVAPGVAGTNVNTFELEFFNTNNWRGIDNTGGAKINTNSSTNTNRRIQW